MTRIGRLPALGAILTGSRRRPSSGAARSSACNKRLYSSRPGQELTRTAPRPLRESETRPRPGAGADSAGGRGEGGFGPPPAMAGGPPPEMMGGGGGDGAQGGRE